MSEARIVLGLGLGLLYLLGGERGLGNSGLEHGLGEGERLLRALCRRRHAVRHHDARAVARLRKCMG